jgi:hypothetical protein
MAVAIAVVGATDGKALPARFLTDPAGQPVEVVRGIIDEIDTRVRALLAELTGPAA